MTAKAIFATRYGWLVQWSDGTYIFAESEGAARVCERLPILMHPGHERRFNADRRHADPRRKP